MKPLQYSPKLETVLKTVYSKKLVRNLLHELNNFKLLAMPRITTRLQQLNFEKLSKPRHSFFVFNNKKYEKTMPNINQQNRIKISIN